MRPKRVELLLAVLFSAGCGADAERAAVAVRDTVVSHAGADVTVQIVESPVDTTALERWRVGGTPTTEIGADDAITLFRVAGAYRLSDGRIVVADGGSSTLKVFAADGALERAIGGPGEGPGEFRSITHFARLPGDSLGVWDIGNGRLTVFTADGVRVRDMRIGATPGSPRSSVIGVFGDGSLLSRGFIDLGGDEPNGLERHRAELLHLHADGNVADSLGAIPGTEAYFHSFEGGFSIYSVPFARSTEIIAAGDRVHIGDTDRPELRTHAADGTPLRFVRWRGQQREVRAEDIDRAREHALEDVDDNRSAGVERMFADLTMPATMPAFGSIRADDEGNVWVRQYRNEWDEGPSEWLVFDEDGGLRALVELPSGFTPTHIGNDHVLGIMRDELDLEYVQLYTLTKG